MDGFLNWFFAFFTRMFGGLWQIVSGIFGGIATVFGIPKYIEQFAAYSKSFTVLDWILSIITLLLVLAIWAAIVFLIVLGIRKYIRFRRSVVGNEDVLQELADMHRDVLRLTKEKEKIMALKIGQTSIPVEAINEIFRQSRDEAMDEMVEKEAASNGLWNSSAAVVGERQPDDAVAKDSQRFYKIGRAHV